MTPTHASKGRRIGYARISTDDQDLRTQTEALQSLGCSIIHADIMSGSRRQRPNLNEALAALNRGDTLVVTRLDRLARSLRDLIEITDIIRQREAHFSSVAESIDTTSAGGLLVFHILGAIAQFERQLISERTKAKLAAVKGRGGRLGNPQLQSSDPAVRIRAKQKIQEGKRKQALESFSEDEDIWFPHVIACRPENTWREISQAIYRMERRRFTPKYLRRAAGAYVAADRMPASILDRTPANQKTSKAVQFVAAILARHPLTPAKNVQALLEEAKIYPKRGKYNQWTKSAVSYVMRKAKELLKGEGSAVQPADLAEERRNEAIAGN